MSTLTTTYPNAHMLLFGNCNFSKIDWHNPAPSSEYDVETRDFLNACLNFNLCQLVSEPTRIASGCANILDLILTDRPDSLSSISKLPEISDHKVIHADFSFPLERRDKVKRTITLYDKGNYEAINNEPENFFPVFEHNFHTQSVNDNWEIFKNKMNELTGKFIPTISFRSSPQKPWFTIKLKKISE